ncbi:MAG: hypothetical protein JKY09_07135 [Crocinitomicaceae bacterium]|nr:hypothetical protein [Crocinitomicaceae bacterium]
MSKKTILAISILTLVVISITILIYINTFGAMPYSKKASDWGAAGDYFGGFLNPIIGVSNVIMLIYISNIVSRNDDRRWSNDLIHSAHEELINKVSLMSSKSKPSDYSDLNTWSLGFIHKYRYLFQSKEDDFVTVANEFGKSAGEVSLSSILIQVDTVSFSEQIKKIVSNPEKLTEVERETIKKFGLNLCYYEEYKKQLIDFIRATMMNQNTKPILKRNIDNDVKKAYEICYNAVSSQFYYYAHGKELITNNNV